MAADTYSLQALVLRKTKLGETDLSLRFWPKMAVRFARLPKVRASQTPHSPRASRFFRKSTCCSYAAKASTL